MWDEYPGAVVAVGYHACESSMDGWTDMMARKLLLLVFALVGSPMIAAGAEVNLRHTITVDVVKKTKGAVVNISSRRIVTQRVSPFGNDPFWQQFDTFG